LRQLFENLGIPYISGVEDAVGPAEGLDGIGPQQAVSVGDYAEGYHFTHSLPSSSCQQDGCAIIKTHVATDAFVRPLPAFVTNPWVNAHRRLHTVRGYTADKVQSKECLMSQI
jgi:hypothetical protein